MIFNNANNTPDEWVPIERCDVPDAKHLYGRALRRKIFKCASYVDVFTACYNLACVMGIARRIVEVLGT